MTEGQAFRVLPDFLTGIAECQFRPVAETTSPEQGGIISWPQAVQWMLRSFATDDAIHNVILAIRNLQQLPNEGERDYYLRLSDASNRCSYVHDAQELVTMYIDGIDRRIKGVVSHYRRTNKHASSK